MQIFGVETLTSDVLYIEPHWYRLYAETMIRDHDQSDTCQGNIELASLP